MIGIVKGMAFKRRNIFFLAELEQIVVMNTFKVTAHFFSVPSNTYVFNSSGWVCRRVTEGWIPAGSSVSSASQGVSGRLSGDWAVSGARPLSPLMLQAGGVSACVFLAHTEGSRVDRVDTTILRCWSVLGTHNVHDYSFLFPKWWASSNWGLGEIF